MRKLLALLALLAGTSVYSHSQCSFTTTTLPNGVVGQAYTASIQTVCGTKKTLNRPAGYPPLGLNISGSTGAVTGTPALAGTYYFRMSVSGTGGTATQDFRVKIVDQLTITVAQPGPIQCGENFALAAVFAEGGVPPYTWSATGLPVGLTIDAVTGTISGNVPCQPTVQTVDVTINVQDSGTLPTVAQVKVSM